jgi:hypothetical protein
MNPFLSTYFNLKIKQETFIIASDQKKAHFPNTIVKNPDFHRKFT